MRKLISVLTLVSVFAGLLVAVLGAAAPASAAPGMISTRRLLRQLATAPEHAAGYRRSLFPTWTDADGDGCNTRAEVLIAEATVRPRVGAGCALTRGRWFSIYDGVRTRNPSTFDVDHLVPLAEAWQSGAWRWNTATRTRYANDLGYAPSLIAVSAHSNRSKGDQEPQNWLPPRSAIRCRYMAWWVAVKWRWRLSVNAAERTFLRNRLRACGWPTVRRPSRPPIGRGSGGGGGGGGGGGSALRGVRMTMIFFNSPGTDTGSNQSLNGEWIRIRNVTGTRRTITGWTLRDASSHVFRFPGFGLAAGATATVHTGSGRGTARRLFWGSSSYIWNNSGDTATLRNARGALVQRCSYTSADDPSTTC